MSDYTGNSESDAILDIITKLVGGLHQCIADTEELRMASGGGDDGIIPNYIVDKNRAKFLNRIWFGDEWHKIRSGAKEANCLSLSNIVPEIQKFTKNDWLLLEQIVTDFFPNRLKGWFGGPITPGDAWFMAAFMMAVKPQTMLEVGVCSGVSSAFILHAARMLQLLPQKDEDNVFLHSVDLFSEFGNEKLEIGRVVGMNFPELLSYWHLNTGCTLSEYLIRKENHILFSSGKIVGFIDANHSHPWPTADFLSMASLLPRNSWILLQDTQVMERWLMESILLRRPCFDLCRGVNMVSTNWPGNKAIGVAMCYNMAALQLDQDVESMKRFGQRVLSYCAETDKASEDKCRSIIDDMQFLQK